MVEKIVSKVLQWMQGKELCELKNALYSVLSDYEISEKSTAVQKIERSWEEELGIFLVRKKVEGRSERTIELYSLHLRRHRCSWLRYRLCRRLLYCRRGLLRRRLFCYRHGLHWRCCCRLFCYRHGLHWRCCRLLCYGCCGRCHHRAAEPAKF